MLKNPIQINNIFQNSFLLTLLFRKTSFSTRIGLIFLMIVFVCLTLLCVNVIAQPNNIIKTSPNIIISTINLTSPNNIQMMLDSDILIEESFVLTGFSQNIPMNNSDFILELYPEGIYSMELHSPYLQLTQVYTNRNSRYYGGKILGRWEHTNNVYSESFIRMGVLNNDYATIAPFDQVSYTSTTFYYGLGLGIGYQLENFFDKYNLNLYARYSWMYLDSENLNISGSREYRFNGIKAHHFRIGMQYNFQTNTSPALTCRYCAEDS